MARYFDSKVLTKHSEDYIKLFKERLRIDFWPGVIEDYLRSENNQNTYNAEIAKIALNISNEFLQKHQAKSDQNSVARCQILKHLMLLQKVSPEYFVQTNELIEKLRMDHNLIYSERQFRKEIIGFLRDNHVIIASSNSGGYKLPNSKEDLIKFVNRYNGIIQPMLSRMRKCRETILFGSHDAIDILDYPEYSQLKEIIIKTK